MSARSKGEQGFALVLVMLIGALLSSLLGAYFLLTRVERTTSQSSMEGFRGFYAAEAGLNLRAEGIRQRFLGFNRPGGAPPPVSPGELPCQGNDRGSGDFACVTYPFQGRDVVTYLTEDPHNPTSIVVPPGEAFQNLHAQTYRYTSTAVARGREGRAEAVVDMEIESLVVPMFQFVAFYNKDLEILPGTDMFLEGPIYTNGDLYTGAFSGVLTVEGQVSVTGNLYHGRKDANVCLAGNVKVYDPAKPRALPPCGPGRVRVTPQQQEAFKGSIQTGLDPVLMPDPDSFEPHPGALYWDHADVRIVLDLNELIPRVQVRHPDGNVDVFNTQTLSACAGTTTYTQSLYNSREKTNVRMLEVDVHRLLNCMEAYPLLIGGRSLDDDTDGGLVVYLGVDGPSSEVINNYGVRLAKGDKLESNLPAAPALRGMTVVTDQAIYIQGDYNSKSKKPAAIMADTLTVLSNNWKDSNSGPSKGLSDAKDTTVYAAFLAGTDTTGGVGGEGVPDGGKYNGGLENYPRLLENWADKKVKLSYRGSFVSLSRPRHAVGAWSQGTVYTPPIRDWKYETDFDDAAKLPPLSPRFVVLRQNLFHRRFEPLSSDEPGASADPLTPRGSRNTLPAAHPVTVVRAGARKENKR